ncbi:MAG: hypothetical protein AB8G86_10030 [Saprospiraceae bacterium]
MLKQIWNNLYKHRDSNKGESYSATSKATGVPVSTVAYHENRRAKRAKSSGTIYWDTGEGQLFLKRMLISLIYTFVIKGGIGAGRVREHLTHLHLEGVVAISENSIYRLLKEIIANILWYKELQEQELKTEASEELKNLKVVLGVDETWLEQMLLVCQDLTTNYIFLKTQAKKEM